MDKTKTGNRASLRLATSKTQGLVIPGWQAEENTFTTSTSLRHERRQRARGSPDQSRHSNCINYLSALPFLPAYSHLKPSRTVSKLRIEISLAFSRCRSFRMTEEQCVTVANRNNWLRLTRSANPMMYGVAELGRFGLGHRLLAWAGVFCGVTKKRCRNVGAELV